ncbi:succinylglutamate desuccinylase/aspartoacylase domain-containing protein [Sulfuriferula nivalis]|nr:succinylglutamate desuccinylase/aspartoacylase family protein [Sulfuriferula nivalis]
MLKSHTYQALATGSQFLVTGAVHGNETCGTRAIRRVMEEIDSNKIKLVKGGVTFIPVTNQLAYHKLSREGDRNLNRNMKIVSNPENNEDHISNLLIPILQRHDVLLDLHSFAAPGCPFIFIGPENNNGLLEPFSFANEEFELALQLGPKKIIYGWLNAFTGGIQKRLDRVGSSNTEGITNFSPSHGIGTTETMRILGKYGVTLECGQHTDPNAEVIAYTAILNALTYLEIIDASISIEVPSHQVYELYKVYDREHLGDQFTHDWVNFSPLQAGDIIATRYSGEEIRASDAGLILFPNPNAKLQNEWFYLAKISNRGNHKNALPLVA